MAVMIRTAIQSDIPYLYQICLETGDSGKDASPLFSDPWLIGQYYAAPYLFYSIDCCFIAEENGIPKGYIIGTDNTPLFNIWFDTVWLPPLRQRYPDSKRNPESYSINEKRLIEKLHQKSESSPFFKEYPAHLHIDLLPDLQGKGCGRLLMDAFLGEMKARRCPGVHLGVSNTNPGAIGFYNKLFFTILKEETWGLTMGKKLT